MNAPRRTYTLLALALGLVPIGCSSSKDSLPREAVSGDVTLDGQPLPKAAIQFTPTGEMKATSAVAEVDGGKFSISRAEGLVPGTYRVSISHAEVIEVKPKKGEGALSKTTRLGKELIPAMYNTQSKLTAEIRPGGAKDLKFELQSK
jgi:hypothetical protein